MPFGHAAQANALLAVEKKPAGHGVQALPCVTKLPGWHCTHVEEPVRDTWPSAHGAHASAFATPLKLPAAHAAHALPCTTNVPGEHRTHIDEAASATKPSEQPVQDVGAEEGK